MLPSDESAYDELDRREIFERYAAQRKARSELPIEEKLERSRRMAGVAAFLREEREKRREEVA